MKTTTRPIALLAAILLACGFNQPAAAQTDTNIYLEKGGEKQIVTFGAQLANAATDTLSAANSVVADVRPKGSLEVTWGEGAAPPEISYWRINKDDSKTFCGSVYRQAEDELVEIQLVGLQCRGEKIRKGVLVEILRDDGKAAYLEVPNRFLPITGADQGISLTLVDRYQDNLGSDVNTGISYYYSLANLKLDRLRLIAQLSALDVEDSEDSAANQMMPMTPANGGMNGGETPTPMMATTPDSDDLRVGIGLGLLFKTGAQMGSNGPGLAIAAGIGYDLMANGGEEPLYTFIGLSVNFQAGSNSQ